MLAVFLRLITLALIAAACGWLLYFYDSTPLLAFVGFLTITLGYTGLLAVEFVLQRFVNQADPIPQPSRKELFRAWLAESLIAPQVLCWRQAFRANAIADNLSAQSVVRGRRGVVFVHGFFGNRGFWTPWLKRLQGRGHAFMAINLEPMFCSIDDYGPQIEAAVQAVTQASGVPPLLVCHSMGGLAARAWLKRQSAETRIQHVVTIATPHLGTWMAQYSHTGNGRQMRLDSPWLAELNHDLPAKRHARFTCWYSNSDNIVFPASNATLPGADNRLVRGAAHVQLAFLPQVMDATLALLDDTNQRTARR